MKAVRTTVVLNNRWGYCYTPKTFPSKRQALEYARQAINDGWAFAYRLIK